MTPDLKALLERARNVRCVHGGCKCGSAPLPPAARKDIARLCDTIESLARENERMREYIKVIFRHVDIAYSARELRIFGMNKDADLLVQCAMDARALLDAQDEPGGEGRDAD